MFFSLSKFVGYALLPPQLLTELLLLGIVLLWTRWRRAGRMLATITVAIFALLAFTPIVALIVRPLEDRFPTPHLAEAPAGIIVLGGAIDEGLTSQRGIVALNDAAERMTEAIVLTRRYEKARLIFTGGSNRYADPSGKEPNEADIARMLWTQLGGDPARMTFEDRSRNTFENAVFTRNIVQPKPGETWLLVTSAMHMPRAIGIFRKIGFPVTAYPVDFRTGGVSGDFRGLRRLSKSMIALELASHEWFGLLSYYVTGKTNALFPEP